MKRRLSIGWIEVLVFTAVLLVSLKVADLIVGMTQTKEWYVGESGRSILLREHPRNLAIKIRPGQDYLAVSEGLEARDFSFRTDADGFILGPEKHTGPVDITFIGGSTTACAYVDEESRFPSLTAQLLRKTADGSSIHTQNAGVPANHTLHSTLNLITKILPYKPRIVVIMENVNDLSLLAMTGSYWRAPPSRALIQNPNAGEQQASVRSTARSIKDFLIPNIWNLLRPFLAGHVISGAVDEFENFRNATVDVSHIAGDFRASLVGVVALLRAWGIEPVLMTQFNRIDAQDIFVKQTYEKAGGRVPWPDMVLRYKQFNEVIRDVAKDSGVYLIDLDKLIPHSKKYIYDAVHLNDAGSRLVAETVAREISGKFKEYSLVSTHVGPK